MAFIAFGYRYSQAELDPILTNNKDSSCELCHLLCSFELLPKRKICVP